MGDATALDCVLGAMQDPFKNVHMGITAENIAAQFGIARETQDALALESQRRAVRAMVEGRFKEQIAAVSVSLNGAFGTFDQDEHVRPNLTIEQLAAMKPVFKEGGSVTSGNASGINDGSAAIVLASASAVRTQDLVPMARVVSFGHVAVDPALMGMGPVPASRLALRRAGLQVRDMDVIECNESSAAQACAVAQALEFNPDRVNPNGSGIALGHPIGATGAILVTKAIYELHRTGGRYALITLCIGGGQGIAGIFERA
jgi:acetyl-CoA C-acetyltransferase